MTVSIIIKTLNDEKRIARTIECALKALPDKDGEIIVTDLGSRDKTIAIASAYPVRIVQISRPARFRSGAGSQLGYQYARNEFICVIEGDMELDAGFLPEALAFLSRHSRSGGVTGHIEDVLRNAQGATARRNGPDSRIGAVEKLSGGGLYRRRAIEAIDYMADRNLHGYEEMNLGIRLRTNGWKLHRLDRPFARNHGRDARSRDLLIEQMRTREPFGIGELLRAATGKPYFRRLIGDLPELKYLALAWVFILASLAVLAAAQNMLAAAGIILASLVIAAVVTSFFTGGFKTGLYAVLTRILQAAALPIGYFTPRRNPRSWIESRVLGEPDAEVASEAGEQLETAYPAGATGTAR